MDITIFPKPTHGHFKDIDNQRFARLTVIGYAGQRSNASIWWCRCDCGKTIQTFGSNLRKGNTKSCGCLNQEMLTARGTHHMSKSRPYRQWVKMKSRCLNKDNPQYLNYGGRGITVCDRWLKFENFFEDMGSRPDGMTLERVNNNLGYSPENCQWATSKEQNNNKRQNRIITMNGVRKTVAQWCDDLGVRPGLVYGRLAQGWDDTRALTDPVRTAHIT